MPMMRIHFDTVADIGFIRIYTAADPSLAYWVNAGRPPTYSTNGLQYSPNCGDHHENDGLFYPAIHPQHTGSSWHGHLNTQRRRCYLGGSNELNGNAFRDTDVALVRVGNSNRTITVGSWLRWPGQVHPAIQATGRADTEYIFPIDRGLNPNFMGVIFVQGDVAVSGTVRGHVTLAATGDIVIVDNLTYATPPASDNRICTIDDNARFDILGLFSRADILVADNTLNSPARLLRDQNNQPYVSLRSPQDLNIHATLLALNTFQVMNYDQGNVSNLNRPCANDPTNYAWGRGCLRINGGIIQDRRGAVGMANGLGFKKDYAYDACVLVNPPPYFPTTGRSARGGYFDIDPTGFNIDSYFDRLVP
jgi:hypothetical protein